MNRAAEARQRSIEIKDKAIADILQILGTTKTDTYYDLKMTPAERGVLIRAANLPDNDFYREQKFSYWSEGAKQKLIEAARGARSWANGLEIQAI